MSADCVFDALTTTISVRPAAVSVTGGTVVPPGCDRDAERRLSEADQADGELVGARRDVEAELAARSGRGGQPPAIVGDLHRRSRHDAARSHRRPCPRR